jgi:hypothetical protein
MQSRTAAVAVLAMLSGCAPVALPSIESPRLSPTDVEVLRITIETVVLPRLVDATAPRREQVVLIPRTLVMTLWRDVPPVLKLPSLPPVPLPLHPRTLPPPPHLALPADMLSDAEQRAWAIRNHVAREIPELGAGIFLGRGSIESAPRIAVSAPSFSSDRRAVLYAEFWCGGACGEGHLVRLRREPEGWRVSRVDRRWIKMPIDNTPG